MKQSSRKLVALFLTLAILLSFATVAFAHDNLDECGEEHLSEDFDLLSPHNVLVDDASCTGTEQTWHMSCYYCGGAEKTEIHACPGAPHIGRPCHWLPA